jgi:hypothetical protein
VAPVGWDAVASKVELVYSVYVMDGKSRLQRARVVAARCGV